MISLPVRLIIRLENKYKATFVQVKRFCANLHGRRLKDERGVAVYPGSAVLHGGDGGGFSFDYEPES
jgi:hypothetical protein